MEDEGYSSAASGYILAFIWAISLAGSFIADDLRWYSELLPFLCRIGVAIPTGIFMLILGLKAVDHETPFDWFTGWENVPYAKAGMACVLVYSILHLCIWS